MTKWKKHRRKGSCWCCGRYCGNGKSWTSNWRHWRKQGIARRFPDRLRREIEDQTRTTPDS